MLCIFCFEQHGKSDISSSRRPAQSLEPEFDDMNMSEDELFAELPMPVVCEVII